MRVLIFTKSSQNEKVFNFFTYFGMIDSGYLGYKVLRKGTIEAGKIIILFEKVSEEYKV